MSWKPRDAKSKLGQGRPSEDASESQKSFISGTNRWNLAMGRNLPMRVLSWFTTGWVRGFQLLLARRCSSRVGLRTVGLHATQQRSLLEKNADRMLNITACKMGGRSGQPPVLNPGQRISSKRIASQILSNLTSQTFNLYLVFVGHAISLCWMKQAKYSTTRTKANLYVGTEIEGNQVGLS